jgi:transcriptional regulator with XRE-family HTH domain
MPTSRVRTAPPPPPPERGETPGPGEVGRQAGALLRTQVADARRVSGHTLASVARRSGLSTAYISQIESGSANPTLHTLAQLAAGLGCDLAELFGASALTTAGPRFAPRFTPLPLLAGSPGHDAIWDVAAPGAAKLSARLVHGRAGDHAETTSHAGEEFVVVLAGTCTLQVGGLTRVLQAGESCHLAAADPHAITDPSDDALLLVVLTDE